MEEKGLAEPNITLKTPDRTTDCVAGLVEGKYDVVVLTPDVAEAAMAKTGTQGKLKLQEHLSYVATLHAVIAKTNPRGKEYLAALNSGIRKIKENGQWFQIVARHLAEHRHKMQLSEQ